MSLVPTFCVGMFARTLRVPVALLDGKPLADAKLTFYLAGSSAPGFSASTGTTDASGKYELNSRQARRRRRRVRSDHQPRRQRQRRRRETR